MTKLLFVLLDGPKFTDIISPVLSAFAFMLSAAAFIFTVLIQVKERKRNLRQTLSTSLSDIAKINVDVSLLNKDEKESTPELTSIRRNYNSQRGALASVADFLIKENPKLITDADCELMALTYDDLGDIDKASEYWLQAIQLSPNGTRCHLHQRDHALFLFNNNKPDDARKEFERALTVKMEATDDDSVNIAHTYIIWANLERNFNNDSEFKRLADLAYAESQKIRHRQKSAKMNQLLQRSLQQ